MRYALSMNMWYTFCLDVHDMMFQYKGAVRINRHEFPWIFLVESRIIVNAKNFRKIVKRSIIAKLSKDQFHYLLLGTIWVNLGAVCIHLLKPLHIMFIKLSGFCSKSDSTDQMTSLKVRALPHPDYVTQSHYGPTHVLRLLKVGKVFTALMHA